LTAGGWRSRFDAPIVLADGTELVTLRDAIRHLVDTVPARERKHPRVLVAATVLIDAAEAHDFMMHARIAVIRALNRNGAKPDPAPQRKPARVYRVVR
jgi:hypothetical protein